MSNLVKTIRQINKPQSRPVTGEVTGVSTGAIQVTTNGGVVLSASDSGLSLSIGDSVMLQDGVIVHVYPSGVNALTQTIGSPAL